MMVFCSPSFLGWRIVFARKQKGSCYRFIMTKTALFARNIFQTVINSLCQALGYCLSWNSYPIAASFSRVESLVGRPYQKRNRSKGHYVAIQGLHLASAVQSFTAKIVLAGWFQVKGSAARCHDPRNELPLCRYSAGIQGYL